MADLGTPMVDFDEIMSRIREEVRKRRTPVVEPALPPAEVALASDLPAPDLEQFEAKLQAAEHVADVGVRLPPMHRQRGLRRRLAAFVAKAYLRLSELVTRDQRVFNRSVTYSLRALGAAVQVQSRRVGGRLGGVTLQLEALTQHEVRLKALVEQVVNEVQGLRSTLGETAASVRREHQELVNDVRALSPTLLETAASVRREHQELVEQLTARAAEQSQAIEASVGRDGLKISDLRVALIVQERRISTLLAGLQRRPAESLSSQEGALVAEEQAHLLDTLYVDFENTYRGTREDIKQRAREYLLAPVRAAGAGTAERPILDLGCGRGEWLEVLREEGLEGRGVDLNRAFVQECRDRGLLVQEGDALCYLKGLRDGSLGALTAIHLLEHLPFAVLMGILDEATRVLRPGGVFVFETPNPMNLTVGARDFYLDPTHRNPLHPETMRFLAERQGLVRVSVLPLHPSPPEARLPDDGTPATQRLNELLYGPRDFAILGYRA